MNNLRTPEEAFAKRIQRRWNYYRRTTSAYFGCGASQLTFWHDNPRPSDNIQAGQLGAYYMSFTQKSDYTYLDMNGIPLLDYRGALGPQYNPIAIAQYGLGNFNQWITNGSDDRFARFLRVSDWLVNQLEPNHAGFDVWMHKFDWDYRETLKAPWYSALAQGQGISVMVRAFHATKKHIYLDAARRAFRSFQADVRDGGVVFTDQNGNTWFEEYIVDPPTHILNGFIWASWGICDYALLTADSAASELFARAITTLERALERFDIGYWSLYELSETLLPMLASPFYHSLHITQLQVMYRLTGLPVFRKYAERWDSYRNSLWRRRAALVGKAVFKLCYY